MSPRVYCWLLSNQTTYHKDKVIIQFAAAAGCPTGCDTCALDASNVVTCTTTGCSAGWFYALDEQCIGQFFVSLMGDLQFGHLLGLFVASKIYLE